jgi:hypothetical protein
MIPLIEQEIKRQKQVRGKEKVQTQADLLEAMNAFKTQMRNKYCGSFSNSSSQGINAELKTMLG